MKIYFDEGKQYLFERGGEVKVVSQIVSKEQMEYEVRDEQRKVALEQYIKRQLTDKLVVDGGVQEDTLYLLTYEKVVDNKYMPNIYRYEMRIVPIERINPHKQEIS